MSLFAPMNAPVADWSGKRVWIIGASSGIGAACARLLNAKGAKVAVSARSHEALQELAQSCALIGSPGMRVLPLDARNSDALLAAKHALLQEWQGLDLVLMAAGIYKPMGALNFRLTHAQELMDTNLLASYRVLDAVLPTLRSQGSGAIAMVASVAGYSGLPRSLAYGPSKAALINLCEALYFELRPRGINVHLIAPGFVQTPLTAKNDFPMPALIGVEEAAQRIVQGIERGEFDIHFPKRFTRVLKGLRLLPYRAYFALLHRLTGM